LKKFSFVIQIIHNECDFILHYFSKLITVYILKQTLASTVVKTRCG